MNVGDKVEYKTIEGDCTYRSVGYVIDKEVFIRTDGIETVTISIKCKGGRNIRANERFFTMLESTELAIIVPGDWVVWKPRPKRNMKVTKVVTAIGVLKVIIHATDIDGVLIMDNRDQFTKLPVYKRKKCDCDDVVDDIEETKREWKEWSTEAFGGKPIDDVIKLEKVIVGKYGEKMMGKLDKEIMGDISIQSLPSNSDALYNPF